MPITLHASSETSQASGTAGTYLAHSLPGTPATNDIVLFLAACDESLSAAGINPTYSYTVESNPGSNDPGKLVAWKRMGSTPDTDVENEYHPDRQQAIIIAVVRGVDTSVALDMARVLSDGDDGMPNPASATTVTDGALRVIPGFLDDDEIAASVGAPSGYGDLLTSETVGASFGQRATVMVSFKTAATAGAENPSAYTGGSDAWEAVHFAFRPAAAAGILPQMMHHSGA